MTHENVYCKPELSKKNPCYISKHRFYELKHLCLQYEEMKNSGDPIQLDTCILIMKASNALPDWVSEAIFKAVTEDYSYTYLATILELPCCRDTYYKMYRQFFYILSNMLRKYYQKHNML